MTNDERKQQIASTECIRLILDNQDVDMIWVHDLLSCILGESKTWSEAERSALVNLSTVALCRMEIPALRIAHSVIDALVETQQIKEKKQRKRNQVEGDGADNAAD